MPLVYFVFFYSHVVHTSHTGPFIHLLPLPVHLKQGKTMLAHTPRPTKGARVGHKNLHRRAIRRYLQVLCRRHQDSEPSVPQIIGEVQIGHKFEEVGG